MFCGSPARRMENSGSFTSFCSKNLTHSSKTGLHQLISKQKCFSSEQQGSDSELVVLFLANLQMKVQWISKSNNRDFKGEKILCYWSFPRSTSIPDRNKNFRMSQKEQRKKGQRQQPLGWGLMERWKMSLTFTSMPKIHSQLFSQVPRNSLEIFFQLNSTRENSLQGLVRNEGIMRGNVTGHDCCSFLPFLALKSKLLALVLEEEWGNEILTMPLFPLSCQELRR